MGYTVIVVGFTMTVLLIYSLLSEWCSDVYFPFFRKIKKVKMIKTKVRKVNGLRIKMRKKQIIPINKKRIFTDS